MLFYLLSCQVLYLCVYFGDWLNSDCETMPLRVAHNLKHQLRCYIIIILSMPWKHKSCSIFRKQIRSILRPRRKIHSTIVLGSTCWQKLPLFSPCLFHNPPHKIREPRHQSSIGCICLCYICFKQNYVFVLSLHMHMYSLTCSQYACVIVYLCHPYWHTSVHSYDTLYRNCFKTRNWWTLAQRPTVC